LAASPKRVASLRPRVIGYLPSVAGCFWLCLTPLGELGACRAVWAAHRPGLLQARCPRKQPGQLG